MEQKRKLFCEYGAAAYALSAAKCRVQRRVRDAVSGERFARQKEETPLPVLIYDHNSLIRRTLGTVDMRLQDNKAYNLGLAAPHVNGILIHPGETFSFWRLVGACTARRGYREGLTIRQGMPHSGIGGGMCQFTNLIHWMVLHTPLTITEHHHHDDYDLFPDYGRQVPFGVGTSILYNYLDYRFRNDTEQTFQLLVYSDGCYLRGELRAERALTQSCHIHAEQEFFSREGDAVYRNNVVFREWFDKKTGQCLLREPIKSSHAKVLYDTSNLTCIQNQP
ncbi:MAG: vancomycin resistance protein [Clostridia bacterium]|nr:vancomycin resistance protein [Clostridia bacterium]